jgi:hypothetical protein
MEGRGRCRIEVLSSNLLGGTDKNHISPQPGQVVPRPRFELSTSLIHVQSISCPVGVGMEIVVLDQPLF